MFEVVVSSSFKARQGLKAPVRGENSLPDVAPSEGFSIIIRAGIEFKVSQLNKSGWFVDTDAVELQLKKLADYLSSDTWTNLFDFRPTFERVAELSYQKIASEIPQLSYVELDNVTLGVKTRYTK
jgi:6-pyruvoyltetrahydropterin/6-carboxytetrahydropterin synthase